MLELIENFISQHASPALATFFIAALPFVELKGAIPIGVALGVPHTKAFLLAYLGSMVPVLPILFLVRKVFRTLSHSKKTKNMVEKILLRAHAKSEEVKRYGPWGLFVFVALPMPGTGVWMGSLVAVLLRVPIRRAFPIIALANIIAGAFIWGLSAGAWHLFT